MSKTNKVTLWSIQRIERYHQLLQDRIIYGQPVNMDADNQEGYDWLVMKMEQRIGKRPIKDIYPIWAWYQYDSKKKKKPDLRRSAHLWRGTKGVRITLEKDISEVLLSDFILWHHPYAYKGFIGNTEEDDMNFETLLKSRGIEDQFDNFPQDIKNEVIKSWEKIFDLDFDYEYYTQKREDKMIQATFWTLSLDEIVKVEEFIAR